MMELLRKISELVLTGFIVIFLGVASATLVSTLLNQNKQLQMLDERATLDYKRAIAIYSGSVNKGLLIALNNKVIDEEQQMQLSLIIQEELFDTEKLLK